MKQHHIAGSSQQVERVHIGHLGAKISEPLGLCLGSRLTQQTPGNINAAHLRKLWQPGKRQLVRGRPAAQRQQVQAVPAGQVFSGHVGFVGLVGTAGHALVPAAAHGGHLPPVGRPQRGVIEGRASAGQGIGPQLREQERQSPLAQLGQGFEKVVGGNKGHECG